MHTSPRVSCANVAAGRLLSIKDPISLATTRVQPILAMSTAELPAEQQSDAWKDHFGNVIEMLSPTDRCGGHPMTCTTWMLGPFALSTVRTPASRYRRTRSQIVATLSTNG